MEKKSNQIICKTLNDLPGIAEKLINEHSENRIFAFYGDMGVGKTTFIKILCEKLGVVDTTCSPSFGIVNQYIDKNSNPIYHFDFYRIKKMEEAFDIGYEDYFYSGNYCFIEWPEKITDLLPDDCIKIFMKEENTERIIEF
jgi:tRNA threonylcarbamoyladenosine biosynthesis protein TsaE